MREPESKYRRRPFVRRRWGDKVPGPGRCCPNTRAENQKLLGWCSRSTSGVGIRRTHGHQGRLGRLPETEQQHQTKYQNNQFLFFFILILLFLL